MQNQPEIRNCSKCNRLFNYTRISDLCGQCVANEEKIYEVVYRFLRRRENRTATVEQIIEVIDVTKELLYKWVRRGRLQPSMFPNLGYPCDNCEEHTMIGKLCASCMDTLKTDLRQLEAVDDFKDTIDEYEEHDHTYIVRRKRK